jgi:DNA-binding NtrC family response regulator
MVMSSMNNVDKSYKVFLVDDEPMVHKMVSGQLKLIDTLDIKSFYNGEDLIESIHQRPDIIVLDFHMDTVKENGINGLQTLMKILELSPETKVIMLSSQDAIGTAVSVLKKGAVDYIVKDGVFGVKAKNAVEKVIQGLELKEEIKELTARIKRDKLVMRGFLFIILILLIGIAAYIAS